MVFPLILLAVIVIVGFVYAFHQYRVGQIAMTDEIARFYAATCAAEAGISCAIGELRGGATPWNTHSTKLDAQGNLVWDAALQHGNIVKPAGALTSYATLAGTSGTVGGTLGSMTLKLSDFKVRCGHASAKDNKDTKAINEENMFYKIEAIGKYFSTYVKVTSIVEARDLSEFLIYDSDFLDMVLGLPGTKMPDASNFFSIGTLYGRRFVYLGTIFGNGNPPVLKLDNMSDISTGSTGEIYVFDPYVTLNGKQLGRNNNSSKINYSPAQGTGAKTITGGTWNADFAKNNVGAKQENGSWAGGIMKDGRHGGRDLPIVNSKTFTQKYKNLAKNGGIYIPAPGGNFGEANTGKFEFKNPYSTADITNLRYVDFGASISETAKADQTRQRLLCFAGMERETNIKDSAISTKLKDPGFNGVIFTEVPLRIRGNPQRDIVIASDKDIYICGDFNQTTDVMQNYKDDKFLEYMPNPLTGIDYWQDDTTWRKANLDKNMGVYRQRVTIFSNAKIWYDYTRPDMVFENELMPYVEWKLSMAIAYTPNSGTGFSV
ncbi:MAG TPA: hypothetical protein PKK26_19565, partial [Candidatus Wallbacteria bacterium]|nr:hypothetical protein [Candidatus Wallbacteria bacterium]